MRGIIIEFISNIRSNASLKFSSTKEIPMNTIEMYYNQNLFGDISKILDSERVPQINSVYIDTNLPVVFIKL